MCVFMFVIFMFSFLYMCSFKNMSFNYAVVNEIYNNVNVFDNNCFNINFFTAAARVQTRVYSCGI
jgi:hypothetical protein